MTKNILAETLRLDDVIQLTGKVRVLEIKETGVKLDPSNKTSLTLNVLMISGPFVGREAVAIVSSDDKVTLLSRVSAWDRFMRWLFNHDESKILEDARKDREDERKDREDERKDEEDLRHRR